MSEVSITGSNVGNSLQSLLLCDEIIPGSAPSYQLCKTIYSYHVVGKKMADAPITLAQSQPRQVSIANSPGDRVKQAFEAEWKNIGADTIVFQVGSIARIYGISALIVGAEGIDPDQPIPPEKMANLTLFFNILDPLNTAGSLVLNQDPNAPDFQKSTQITSAGKPYHRSRSLVLMNERPLYIDYTGSAFGYVGRSVYQRALFPLKSFVSSMIADDMIARKLGLIVAKLKAPGSIIDSAMKALAGVKRQLLKEASTNNVLSISIDEDIQTLDMQNVDGAGQYSRTNILKNIATAAEMPAILLENETLVSGFGEGSEDSKAIASYVKSVREWLQPVYDFLDEIVMRRAWNEEFYEIIQKEQPDQYKNVKFEDAFYRWKNSFEAAWPSLLEDPESEAEKEDVRQKAVLSMLEVLLPAVDPYNKAKVIEWAVDNAGQNKLLFPQPLELDYERLTQYFEEQPAAQSEFGAGAEQQEPSATPKPQLVKPPATFSGKM